MDLEILFKAQMQALEQILCFGNAILANNTDYDRCEFDTCGECPNMNITYTEPPAEIDCSEALTQKPCDSNFLNTEYGTWTNSSEDLLAACKACPQAGGGAEAAGGNSCAPGTLHFVGPTGNDCYQTTASAFKYTSGATGCCSEKGFTVNPGEAMHITDADDKPAI